MFKFKQHTGNYHDEMNHQNFEEWFTAALLPNISPNSIIVVDNALHHRAWTKVKMMDWLSSKGIAYQEKCQKCDIWKIVEKDRPQCPIYVIDEVVSQAGKC